MRESCRDLVDKSHLCAWFCFSVLAKNTALLSSPDLEENLPFLIEPYREKLEASGLITDEV